MFIDGVLQRDTDSYSINGPAIRFTRKIFANNNVEIMLLYGRDMQQSITFHDFQPGTYYNRLELTVTDTNANAFTSLYSWFNTNYDNPRYVYQKNGVLKNAIGDIKTIETLSD